MGSIDEKNQRIKISRYCPFKYSRAWFLRKSDQWRGSLGNFFSADQSYPVLNEDQSLPGVPSDTQLTRPVENVNSIRKNS
jgi:hypothetical protein